jgi:signal transduction histidine kinase
MVRFTADEREVRFEISDTGPGVPLAYQQKIFDKFERITAEKQEGTGLGLSIAKDIVELHKGKIWVESKIGEGSCFIFTLPRGARG